MSNKTGGFAFPAHHVDLVKGEHGMMLRDYFAAKAMSGLLAAGRDAQYGDGCMDDLAEASYLIADAMLDAREGKK